MTLDELVQRQALRRVALAAVDAAAATHGAQPETNGEQMRVTFAARDATETGSDTSADGF